MQLNRENGCVEIMGDRTNVLECEVEILRIIEEGTARNAEKEKQLQNQGRGGQHHQRGERGGRGKTARGDEGAGTGEEIGAETAQGGVVAAEREKARGEAVAIAARDESSDERRVQGEDSTARAQGDVDDDATGWASERAW